MDRNFKILSGFIIFLLLCFSCNHGETYYQFYEIKDSKWSKNDTIVFDIDTSSIKLNVPMDVQIDIVSNSDYLYQNIWLYIYDNFSDSIPVRYDKQYNLADEFGKWLGSGFGSLFQLSLDYKKSVIFTEKKNYRMKIIQGMRDEPLNGIEKIGIKLYIPNE